MINLNELRIGNHLNYANQQVYVRKLSLYNKLELGYFTDSIGFERETSDRHLSPIPLTEQHLIDFGFTCNEGWGSMIFWSVGDGYTRFTLEETEQGYTNGNDRVIPYVHLLQNAYFFDQLDGSELTLKTQTNQI